LKIKYNKFKENAFVIPIEETMKIYKQVLYAITALYILYNTVININFGIKAITIFIVSIIVSRESEILFYSHFKKADRAEAKLALKETYPEITAILLAIIMPIGTPLVVVGISALFSSFIVKHAFGGFSYNVFNPAIVGLLFAIGGFPSMVKHTLKSYLIGTYDPNFSVNFFGMNNFIPVSVILIIACAYLIYKKVISYIIPCTVLVTLTVMVVAMSIIGNVPMQEVFNLAIKGYFIFGLVFLATDPITSPNGVKGKFVYGVMIGIVAIYLSMKTLNREAIFEAILFTNIFVPFINATSKEKKYVVSVIVSLVVTCILSYYIAFNYL
jgi:Na+-translocating ferredoxin:NAD+ oxidoreductase subunit D